jgi:futalosine hydrolase
MDQLPQGLHVQSLITGVGSIPTAWSLTRAVVKNRPDCIIQAGIAGSFNPGNIGQVMAVKEEAFGDVGVQEKGSFQSIFDLNLLDRDIAPFSNGLLVNPYNKWLDSTGVRQVRAITINEITTSSTRIEWYQQNIAPVVESMEGAALHYVCLQERIPFLQLRAVSNDIGQRDKSKWDFPGSIAALNSQLASILENLSPDLITL